MTAQRFFPFALLMLFALSLANLLFGAVSLSLHDIWHGLFVGSEQHFTVYEYRLPRIFLAILVGAGLALSGALVQGVIRNPLASPDVLGVSHGAGLAAVFYMTYFSGASTEWLPEVALSGGICAALILWYLCGNHSSAIKLAILGVALAAFWASCIDFMMLTKPLEINNALLWLTGSLWGRSWPQLQALLPWFVLVPFALGLSKYLNVLDLGDDSANSLGVSPQSVRLLSLAIAVALTAACVSVCGPIGFLGLVAPHLTRKLVGGRHQSLLPASMLTGACLLLAADLAARTLAPPIELPAGILTAIIGAPYFLWLLLRMK
ncbi:MAG: Fe(3+) dicitrate ABC transporter permease subunit FecD [Marinomonas atlantica]|nr:Fe(3+) dicitrate ABC transporter permease subunit FecD [Marinomonas atlantica]